MHTRQTLLIELHPQACSMKTKKKEKGKGKSHLQRNDRGDGPDHGVLQHSQLAPKEQHSAKAREHSISAIPRQQNTNPFDKSSTTLNSANFVLKGWSRKTDSNKGA